MSDTSPLYEFEVQWEGMDGSRRTETIKADGYNSYYEPCERLEVYVYDGNQQITDFEIVGFPFTISRIDELE